MDRSWLMQSDARVSDVRPPEEIAIANPEIIASETRATRVPADEHSARSPKSPGDNGAKSPRRHQSYRQLTVKPHILGGANKAKPDPATSKT